MSTGTFFYFAYGSNMLTARLQVPERCPSARPVGVAELCGHELRWHKRSLKDGSGKCDIVASAAPDASVFGVLYEIAASDKPALDREEGLGKGYDVIEVDVLFKGSLREARSYQATNADPTLRPYTWYHALVLAGAREHSLPDDYIARLATIPAIDDSNCERHDTNMRLIAEVRV